MMLSKLRTFLVCTIALLLSDSAIAQKTIHVPADQPTIQAGINAANAGDTVLVAPGTYYENIDFMGKAITVTSTSGASGGAANTIIDGSKGQNPAVVFRTNEGSHSILNGFTIQGGGYDEYPPPANNYGTAGVLVSYGTPIISNNILTHNFCNAIESSGSPLIEDNEIDNTLDSKGECGFAGGSAIWLMGSMVNTPATVLNNLIQNNTESGRDDAGGNGGTGVAVWGAFANIIGNTIRNNVTFGDGGAILSFNTDNVNVIGNLIYGNQASTDGAISMLPPGATVGPFIGIIASNTIYGNTQTTSVGGAYGDSPPTEVYFSGNLGQYLLVNNIIVSSGTGTAAVACGSTYNYLSYTPLVFDHNDLYNASGQAYGGVCHDQTGTFGNISVDPEFSNPANGDFTLRAGSAAIDSGNNSAPSILATDITGAPRIQDATGKGYPVVDMGAYEVTGVQDVAPTILTLTPSEYFVPFSFSQNAPLTFTVNLSSSTGTPSGAVTILIDNLELTTVLVGSTGSYVYTPAPIAPGLHAFTATYPGSGIYPPAVSVKFYLLIPPITTTLTLSSSPNPSNLNNPVTFTVEASAADGTIPTPITLTDQTANVLLATLKPNTSGIASFTTSTLSIGEHQITAGYAGNSTYAAASAYLIQDVLDGTPTTTGLSCSASPVMVGSTTLLSAMVSAVGGAPTGTIRFTDDGVLLGQSALGNGGATYSYLAQVIGTHTIVATYVPTGNFAASNGTCLLTVNGLPTVTTVAVAPNPSTYGQPVLYTTHVAPVSPNKAVPTGTVLFTFCRGATYPVTLDANGNGSFYYPLPNTIANPVGSCSFTGQYSGDNTFAPSTSAANAIVVTPAPSTTTILSATPNPAYVAQTVAFTVQVVGVPSPTANPVTGQPVPPGALQFSGTVQLFSDGNLVGSAPATVVAGGNGETAQATVNVSTLAIGSHVITASYGNDPNLGSSSSGPVTEVIVAAPPADFSLTGPQSITFRTESSGGGTLTLASINGFAGAVSLTCNPPLPVNYVCVLQSASANVPANGGVTVGFTLHPNYVADAGSVSGGSRTGGRRSRMALAALLPLTLLSLAGMRRRRSVVRAMLTMVLLGMVAMGTTACGPDQYYAATPPGTYPVTFTGTGANQGSSTTITHTATVNVIITR